MLELDHFVLTCKNDLMLTYDGSATNCGDSDLLIVTFLTFLAAVIYIMILVIHNFINAVCQCKCSTTWCVYFQAVMFLNDLHVKSCSCKNLGSVLNQFQKCVDTKRHVRRFQHCNLFGCFFYFRKLLLA